MIVGLGLDIAEIDRIEAAIKRHGAPFLERLFTPAEVSYCEQHKNRFERYAARFAAKEAAMKALGTGWSRGVRWRDIEVARRAERKTDAASCRASRAQIADGLGVKNISLSITHSGNLALAAGYFRKLSAADEGRAARRHRHPLAQPTSCHSFAGWRPGIRTFR